MAVQLPNGRNYFATATGAPGVGYRLYTYVPGTSTPKDTYTTSAGSTPNTNPVVADARGEMVVYWDGAYDVVLRDSSDALIWGPERLDTDAATDELLEQLASTASASDGANLVGYLPSLAYTLGAGLYLNYIFGRTAEEIAAGVTPTAYRYFPLDPRRFGADSTGVADSSTAVANTLLAYKRVKFPEGTFKCAFDLLTTYEVEGEGERKTILTPPAGATYVIRIDASSVAKQFCKIRKLSINNLGSVANCVGIEFKGDNVNDINDYPSLSDLYIGIGSSGTGFLKGIKVTGRMIWTGFERVEVYGNTKGWHSATDPASPSFNDVRFIGCRFSSSEEEGFLHTGPGNCVNFIGGSCESNNSNAAAAVAGMDVSDPVGWTITSMGFEENGNGVAGSATVLDNSIGIRLRGTVCTNVRITGTYHSGAGACIVVDATTVSGGYIGNNNLVAATSGYAFAGLSAAGQLEQTQPMVYSANNQISGTVSFTQDVNGNTPFCVEQATGIHYTTSAVTIDFLKVSKFDCNTGGGAINFTTLANNLPGCRVVIANNNGANNVTVAAGLMKSGGASTITPGTSKTYEVLGGANTGKLIEV